MIDHGAGGFGHKTGVRASRPRWYLLVPVFLGLLLLLPAQSRAAQPAVGRIATIESESGPQIVNLLRLGKTGFARAKTGDPVFEGDTVKTGPGVKAQIELSDKSIINVGPSATLRVRAYLVNAKDGKRNYVLKALKGTIRFIIAKTFETTSGTGSWKDSNVTVETPTAVAGIRGTDFFVLVDTSGEVPKVTIAVNEGVVNVRSSSLRIAGSVDVAANRMTIVLRGRKPAEVAAFADQLRDELTRATTPSKSAGAPQQTSGGKKGTYTQADICNDLSAGVPLAEVMSRATDTRMAIGDIVEGALDCGIPAYDVVYTAVSEGYSAQAVVTAALDEGADLVEVVAAAMMAGAENKAIITGAVIAGYSPEEVAAVIAELETNQAPVYGKTLPGGGGQATVGNTVPRPPVLIGGGGGAPASTQPASPYRP